VGVLLEVSDLRTYFFTDAGIVKAVDGVSYDVNAGETVALVGESGCGKSVSALSIMRLMPSSQARTVGGRVLFEGIDLLAIGPREMRRVRGQTIAMMYQEPRASLNPVLNLGRQLTEGMQLHLGISHRDARRRAIDLLRRVRIPDPESQLSRYPHQFSGGMLQRVVLAMALSCNPKLILADEPTTALDVTIQAQILELLKELAADFGLAVVLITHNLGVVARYADRVNVMYAGKVVEHADVGELFANPRHPYTRGLLSSLPRLDAPRSDRLVQIEGQPPDLRDVPAGCAYHPRCAYAYQRCREETPPLLQVGSTGHLSACWVAENLP